MFKSSSIAALLCLVGVSALTACGGGSGASLPIPQPTATATPLIPNGGPGPQTPSPSPTAAPTATPTAVARATPVPSPTPTAAPSTTPSPTPSPTTAPGTLHFLVRQLGIMDGTSATIRTGFSFNGNPYTITITNPSSGITAQWTGGDLRVQGHCPTFTPATDIVITDNLGNQGSITVSCASIPPGTTSFASPFSMIVEPKAHQDVSVYGLGQPITINAHNSSVTDVAPDVVQGQFIITSLAVGTDGVTFQDNASPPNSAGVTVVVVAPN